MALPWPDHLLTVAEWDELPEDSSRVYELVEGVLHVTPRPAPLHQRVMVRLAAALDTALPPELTALADVEVEIDGRHPATLRAPDVTVTRTSVADASPARLAAKDVVLAVEILSSGTRRTDRVTKLVEYAEAGIPYYWIVDLESPVTLTAHVLVEGDYEVLAEATGVVMLESPLPLRIDLPTLVTRT